MKIGEGWIVAGAVALVAVGAAAATVWSGAGPQASVAATEALAPLRTYSGAEFRRVVLFKNQSDVVAAVGKPTEVSDLAGGGQLYTYALGLPSSSFRIRDDATGVDQNGAQVRFDALGQAERVEFY